MSSQISQSNGTIFISSGPQNTGQILIFVYYQALDDMHMMIGDACSRDHTLGTPALEVLALGTPD